MNEHLPGLPDLADLADLADPRGLSRRLDSLRALARTRHDERLRTGKELVETRAFLELLPRAEALLENLSNALFGELLSEIEQSLTQAIREILGQERTVRAVRGSYGGRLHVHFEIEQDGCTEDVLTGQGGSVCNILSVGLRLIALSQLDPARHRPFLVLDEQDCWLKPELVPRLIGVVKAVAERLGIQVLIISHHSLDHFSLKAERIYGLAASREHGVEVRLLAVRTPGPAEEPDTSGALDSVEE